MPFHNLKGSGNMRYALVISILILGVSQVPSAQTYGLDSTDPVVFSKFKIPETNLHAFWLGAGLYGSSQRNSSLFNSGLGSESRYNHLDLGLTPRFYMLKQSDDAYFSINSSFNGGYSYQGIESDGLFSTGSGLQKYVSDNLSVSNDETLRLYSGGSDLFYSVGSSGQYSLQEEYRDYSQTDSTRIKSYAAGRLQRYSFSVGIGWGRMRDVTAVVSAVRFQERMKQLNLINSNLSQKTIEDLAQQFYRQGYYSLVHVRPDKYFWQGVGNVLSQDGVSLGGLNQYADSYLREVPNELRFIRNEGLIGGFGFGIDYYSMLRVDGGPTPDRYLDEEFTAAGNVYVKYSHQLDLNSQLRFEISADGGPNLKERADIRQRYDLNFVTGYDYELTDRVVASLLNTFSASYWNSNDRRRHIFEVAGLTLTYFVEDNTSLSADYRWEYSDQRDFPDDTWHDISVDHILSVSLTYYLNRALLIP